MLTNSNLRYSTVFRKSNFFLFSVRESYADQNCSGCLFSILSIFRVVKIFEILMKKNIFFQNRVVMHVLYFLLKKLMEPPFSEYLVLLKTELRLVTYLFYIILM
jgi:hypothetical protein